MTDNFPEQIKGATHFSDPAYPLFVNRVSVSDAGVQPHCHDFVEAVFVSGGQGQHQIFSLDEQTSHSYPIIAGDIFLIAPDSKHAYHDNNNLEVYNIIFQPEIFEGNAARLCAMPGLVEFLMLEPLFREEDAFQKKLHLTPQQANQIKHYLDEIISEHKQQEQGYQLLAKSLFIEMLVRLGRFVNERQNDESDSLTDSRRKIIEQAIGFMEERYSDALSLDDIATHVYLSPNYFSEVFKQSTGIAPWEYVTQLRLDEACDLLRNTDRSITDIALSVGFGDSSYFSKVFKERYQKTPRDFRKQ